nr:hypothetical protein [Tanacetum cinerariifolium]
TDSGSKESEDEGPNLEIRALVQTPASPEWSFNSLPVSPASLTIPTPVASLVPATTVGEGKFLEGYSQDFTELFARSGVIGEEIHSQHFRLRSLKQGQEQATIIFGALWRPFLALEAWCAADQRKLQELRERVATLERRLPSLGGGGGGSGGGGEAAGVLGNSKENQSEEEDEGILGIL